jgi:hypothetical protein
VPRYNHLELTVPRGSLDDGGKKKIVAFYNELFGWVEALPPAPGEGVELSEQQRHFLAMLSAPGFLAMRCSPDMPDQSFILSEADVALDAGSGGIPSHAGLLMNSFEELDAVYAKIKAMQESDPEIETMNEDKMRLDEHPEHTDLANRGFYLRYRSALWWDVQYIDRASMPVIID